MQAKYIVKLSQQERLSLEAITRNSKKPIKNVIKAKILLKIDKGLEGPGWDVARVSEAFDVSLKTIFRMQKKFVEEGYEAVLSRRPYPKNLRRKFYGEEEAKLIALCCSAPPEGRASWSLRLLADKVVELQIVDSASHEGIRKILKKMKLSHG
jgi:hypothetical protein